MSNAGHITILPERVSTDWKWFAAISGVVFLILTAIMLGFVFLSPSGTVLSQTGLDIQSSCIADFNFNKAQYAIGHIALWNPHMFSGTAWLATCNPEVCYPLNWLVSIFPVDTGMNLYLCIHFFLMGWLTCIWCGLRRISLVGSILAGIVMEFSGAMMLHLLSGHCDIVSVTPSIIVTLMSIDQLIETGKKRWVLIGSFAVGLSLLTGFAQLIYYAGLLAVLYTAIRICTMLWQRSRTQRRIGDVQEVQPISRFIKLGLLAACIYAGGTALGALEMLPAAALQKETGRAAGVSYEMASSCPETPENFITLIDPTFFGRVGIPSGGDITYFGRWYPWEVVQFLGVGVLVLAAFGAIYAEKNKRRLTLTLAVLCIILSMGNHTPAYNFLYAHLPMYSSFRSTNRFNILTTLFVSLLAGAGFDAMRTRIATPTKFAVGVAVMGILVLCASLWIRQQIDKPLGGGWGHILSMLTDPKEQISVPVAKLSDPDFIYNSGQHASDTLLLPAFLLIGAAGVVLALRFSGEVAYALVLMAAAEVLYFAWNNCPTTPMDAAMAPAWVDAIKTLKPDDRVCFDSMGYARLGMVHNYNDAYGYDPVFFSRYADFFANLQMDRVPQMKELLKKPFNWMPPVVVQSGVTPQGQLVVSCSARYGWLRCRYLLTSVQAPNGQGRVGVNVGMSQIMPRALLMKDWQLTPTRDALFDAMNQPGFDPRDTLLLETNPDVMPSTNDDSVSNGSKVQLNDVDSDTIEVTADLAQSRLLLITDSYAKDWRVTPLDSTAGQAHYTVMPGDYTFRVIPLQAGHHHFLLEYAPKSFDQGRAITVCSMLAWLGMVGWFARGSWPLKRAARRPRIVAVPASAAAGLASPARVAPAVRAVPVARVAPTTSAPTGPAARPAPRVIPIPRYDGFHSPPPRNPSPPRSPAARKPAPPASPDGP